MISIGERFADLSLPKAEWTHAAHFAACIWLLHCRTDLHAERDMPGMIRRYNEATGGVNSDDAGYHETITQASIRATRAHLTSAPQPMTLQQIHAGLMKGPCGRKDWLLDYWSRANLMSRPARREWVDPDRAPLPF
ncbi:MAG: hypothetical protein QHC67_02770 [Sphingobium sp.]|nr:hypothetical protein [Sphingobium sp.]MDX3908722.1 hypothetical protein [Sphingobium sp.]